MGSEIAISQAVHQAVPKRIQQLRGSWLRDANSSSTSLLEISHFDVCGARYTRIRRMYPVNVKLPQVQRAGTKRKQVVGRTGRRWRCSIEIRGQQAESVAAHAEALRGCGSAGEHGAAVQRASQPAYPRECGGILLVDRNVISVWPNSKLWVIRIVIGEHERIAVPASGGIRGGRYSYALVKGAAGLHGALRHDPPSRPFVLLRNDVAAVAGLAQSPETAKNAASLHG